MPDDYDSYVDYINRLRPEVLLNGESNVLRRFTFDDTFRVTRDRHDALSPFLNVGQGFHVAVICSDYDLERDLISYYNLINDSNPDFQYHFIPYRNLATLDRHGIEHGKNHYITFPPFGQDVFTVITVFLDVLKAFYLNNNDEDLPQLEALRRTNSRMQRMHKECKETGDGDGELTDAVQLFFTQTLDNLLTSLYSLINSCFDIKLISFLPRSAFQVFSNQDLYFPQFIECVLEAVREDPILRQDNEKMEYYSSYNGRNIYVKRIGGKLVEDMIFEKTETNYIPIRFVDFINKINGKTQKKEREKEIFLE